MLVAVAILAIVTVVLLGRRVEIIRDTARAKDQRMAWALLAQKMSEIELDPDLFLSEGGGNSGDFHDMGPEYGGFDFRYEYSKEDVPTNDPNDRAEQPKRIFRVKLFVRKRDEDQDLAALEAMFLVPEIK